MTTYLNALLNGCDREAQPDRWDELCKAIGSLESSEQGNWEGPKVELLRRIFEDQLEEAARQDAEFESPVRAAPDAHLSPAEEQALREINDKDAVQLAGFLSALS